MKTLSKAQGTLEKQMFRPLLDLFIKKKCLPVLQESQKTEVENFLDES